MAEKKLTRLLCLIIWIHLLASVLGGFCVSAQSVIVNDTLKYSICDGNCIGCPMLMTSIVKKGTVNAAPLLHSAPVLLETTKVKTKFKDTRFISNFPAFAVKTNMLYDLGSILNIKIEAPITPRWSVGL